MISQARRLSNDTTDSMALQILGNRITKMRLVACLSQVEFATKAGVSSRTIARVESGYSVGTYILVRILRGLGILENLHNLIPTPLNAKPLSRLRARQPAREGALAELKREATDAPSSCMWRWGDEERPLDEFRTNVHEQAEQAPKQYPMIELEEGEDG